ncbi:uncharacterized protein LOC130686438 [Daphnia carinata]|uniref:uncharacterized protein LOC130686438 n=1 Tax=Daphnia carinata TaxID=120202 RepID=UPI0028693AFC|nr:uncharacterized protein LOC130686438 [Daphnia carinata]
MHLIEKTSAGPTSSPEMAQGQRHNQQLRVNSRPWDYDTEDSGVDSVSSLAGLEADSSHATISANKASSVEYSAVIVGNNKVHSAAETKQPVQQRKSFLHTVYGGAQQSRRSPPALDCNANQNLFRKNVVNRALTKREGVEQSAGHDTRALESAKNNFLHSLLDDEEAVGLDSRSSRAEQPSPPPPLLATEPPASSTSVALDLLPELVQLLDANGVMDGGLIELIGRDGTRASLRVTLAPPSGSSCCSSATSSVMTSRKNSFNSRLHRNSKRSSQRRCKQADVADATSIASSTKSASSSGSTPSLSTNLSSGGAGFIAQRPRSVRRRPSSSSFHKKVPGFSVSMAIPPSKVAILASKFNSLINESRRQGNTSATASITANHNNNNTNVTGDGRDNKSSDSVGQPIAADTGGIPAPNQRPISSTWSWRLVAPTVSCESVSIGPKRNNLTSNVGRSRPIDTIPEILDPPPEESDNKSSSVDKARRKSHDLSQPYGGRFHSVARPLPSDPAGSSSLKNGASVYGTVMSIVKQAIRKFEKFEDGKVVGCDPTSGHPTSGHPSAPAAGVDGQLVASSCSVHYQEPTAVIPEGIEPNNSFLWRDQKSMQSLIYEATSFNERVATTAAVCGTTRTNAEPCDYYEMGSSKYDTLRSRQSNAYDTLHHRNQSKSSSSSSSGYDEIQSPCSLTSNPSDAATSVKYDDVKLTPNCVTYDELSYLTGRRQSNGYDELMRSPLSTTSSGGYIDPGSSSALGYERILPPEAEQTEDEDGSTLRYEECGSPSGQASSSVVTVTAMPAIVCEDQLDSISYLYDDIRTVDLGRNSRGYGGCYSGSNHSYEPIYAHLGEATSKMGGLNSSPSSMSSSLVGQNDKSSDTLSDSSVEGVHEVCSYKLTQMGSGAVPDSPAPSLAGTSTSTRTGTERRSETSDEWIDISDPEEPAWTVTRIRQRHEVTNASFVRRGHRASRRKLSIPKASGQQSWSQTMRTLVKNGFNKATTLSKRAGKDVQQVGKDVRHQVQRAGKLKPSVAVAETSNADTFATSAVHMTKSSARRLPSAETEASGTGSSQTWEDYGESDGDDLADDHHYEALYEVINPRLTSMGAAASVTLLDHHDDSFDDSFDSDDAFEEVVVRGLDATSDTSRERPGSRSGSERSKESEDPSLRSGQVKIGRFADLAGEQMRRLRRNWTTTKTDIGKSITRIKKKSTASVADLSEVFKPSASRREMSPDKSNNGAANKEPIYSPSSPTSPGHPEVRPNSSDHKKKGTWAMRQIRRRMTIVSPTYGVTGNKEKASTFYLTLTIEQPTTPVKTNNKSPAVSEASSPEPVSTPSPVPPLISPQSPDSSKVPVRPKRISSAFSIGPQYQSTVRPKTAPPAPPVKSPVWQQHAAAESALAASPPPLASVPAKKPLSRLPTAFSESRIAAERSLLMDQSMNYSDIAFVTHGQRSKDESSAPLTSLSTPYSRLSMASVTSSRHSSETYMGVGDLASAPERSTQQDNVRNYLDLQSPIESEELYISSHFADEPLYQFYTAAIIERATQNQGDGSEEDDYEVIGEHRRKEDEHQDIKGYNAKLPTAMELVMPSSGRRTLWCELPQVINSGLLETISPQQRKLQEAKFELITSEASYLRSLNVLTTHFIQSCEFSGETAGEALLTRLERHTLFSDIVPVRECSEALLADLERRWQENVFIREICDILLEHASKHFEVYIKYCTNQLYQERMLRELKETKPMFVDCLRRLEASPVCQSLAMHSFLMLPMQRITRLPLLVDAIFHRLDSGSAEFERCRMTLATLNKIVQECNEGARKAERIHEMLVVSNQLDFADVKAISIMSASRWLVKKGEMQRLMWRDIDARLTFGRKIHKQTVYVFLFTDLLVITKKKGEDSYAVLDYCPRNMVQVDEHMRTEKPIGKPGSELGKNLILLTMLQNHENKTVEMILSCSSESDRTRWLEAVTPRTSDNPEEKIYEEWDCPQVQVIHPYVATQPDELSLEVADVVNVLRKMADGWYQGERMRDDQRGWFPGNYTVEIASSHVRARNLRQRYRLLALSGNFIEEQARKDKEENKRKSKKSSIILNE